VFSQRLKTVPKVLHVEIICLSDTDKPSACSLKAKSLDPLICMAYFRTRYAALRIILVVGLLTADIVTATDEQCESGSLIDSTIGAQPEEGHALLQRGGYVEQIAISGEHRGTKENATKKDAPLSLELSQLSAQLPVQDLEKMVVMMREMKQKHQKQDQPAGDPSDRPWFAPPPKSEDTQLPEAEEPVDQTYVMAKFVVVPISMVFFICYTLSTLMEKFEITWLPESAIVIAIGVVLGCFMKRYSHLDFFEDEDAWGEINTTVLNLLLLPIIIFASGWSLRRHDFYSQLPYILLFAVVGTAISTCVIAGLINYTGQNGLKLHHVNQWRTAFCYASLISATDPVATLSTYSKLKVHPLLNIMVFGESTINDAVAIVLFKVFNSNEFMGDPATGSELSFSWTLIGSITKGIAKGFFGSLIFGVFLGMVYTFIARAANMKENKKAQILIIFVSCYLTYALAETVGLSGIIAETFCSLVMAVYMRPHLSSEGCVLTSFFVKQIATLADSAVFLLVGVSVVQLSAHGWKLGILVVLFCLIARATSTYPIAFTVNALKAMRGTAAGQDQESWHLLEQKHMFMMWHAGLRGGIALALAWELGHWVDVAEGPRVRHALQTATFLVILIFLIVFGGSTSACLQYLGIECGQEYSETCLSKTEYKGFGDVQGLLKRLDTHILSPVLIGTENKEETEAGEKEEPKGDFDADAEDLLRKSMNVHHFSHS
jgi:sodium/hydrogen exchanger 8